MPRFAVILVSIFVSAVAAEPIQLGLSPGPEHHFEVLLSTDKDRPEYEELKFKDDSYPMIIVRSLATKDILVEFPFPADPHSDMMPLRNHIILDWSPSGTHLAVTARERFYSHLLIFCLRGSFAQPEAFEQVDFPALSPVIEAVIPGFKEFRSRWHSHLQGWPGRNKVMFTSGTSAIVTPREDGDPGFLGVYSFVFDISDPKFPVMQSMTLVGPNDY